MSELELKPCPFCGGPAEIVNINEGENEGGSCVCCTTCLASGNVEFEFKENFVNNWNRRVSPLSDKRLADANDYSIQLQRIIEAICHDTPLREDSKTLHHYRMAEKFMAELNESRTNLRHWREECGKLHSQLEALTKASSPLTNPSPDTILEIQTNTSPSN